MGDVNINQEAPSQPEQKQELQKSPQSPSEGSARNFEQGTADQASGNHATNQSEAPHDSQPND